MSSSWAVKVFATGMLLAGSFNTITTKLQDSVVVGTEAGESILFKHPAFQTAIMFLGESLCLLPFFIRKMYKRRNLSEMAKAEDSIHLRKTITAFAVPAMCDAAATTLLNLGLFYTYASVFQMLRGTMVIFAGTLTIILLKRRLHSHHWMGMILIAAGAALVGASSIIFEKEDEASGKTITKAPNPLLGDLLVMIAQLLNAAQFIIEEKFLAKYRAPVLLAVGSEGLFGVLLSCAVLPILAYVPGPDGQPLDSITVAWSQVKASGTLQWTTVATIFSIAAFNFCGVSVTKRLSGASRAAIDACRTAIIWVACIALGWERFHALQVVGFLVLISGTSVYNEILASCLPSFPHDDYRIGSSADVEQPLLADDGDEQIQPHNGDDDDQAHNTTRYPGFEAGAGHRRRNKQDYSMARSVTLLPGALSPHSMGSIPSGVEWRLANGSSSSSSSRSSLSGDEEEEAATTS